MKFKFLEHTADIKFQAFGKTKEEAYKNSVLALKKVIYGKLKVNEKIKKIIEIVGEDDESLLYNFLEEFLFLLDSENFLVSNVLSVKFSGNKLVAEVIGDDSGNYSFTNDVKAITYNQMFVIEEKGEWVIQCVLDV